MYPEIYTGWSLFFFFAIALGMWDLGSPTRDGTHTPALEVWSLNHCQGSPRMEF